MKKKITPKYRFTYLIVHHKPLIPQFKYVAMWLVEPDAHRQGFKANFCFCLETTAYLRRSRSPYTVAFAIA